MPTRVVMLLAIEKLPLSAETTNVIHQIEGNDVIELSVDWGSRDGLVSGIVLMMNEFTPTGHEISYS